MNSLMSSSDFAWGKFRPHGEVSFRLRDGILYSECEGPFNVELVVASDNARCAALKKWASVDIVATIATFKTSLLGSTDTWAEFERCLNEGPAARLGRRAAVAWVIPPEIEGRTFLLPTFGAMFKRNGVPWKPFESLAPAQAWVQAQIAAFSSNDADYSCTA